MIESDPAGRKAARERQSHVRHELRAPLAVMYPLLSLLLDGGAGELTVKQREYLEILERNAVRLEGLLGSVADSGWADCSAAPAAAAEVSLSDVVDEVLSVRHAGREGGVRIDARTGSGPLRHAWADRDDARQVVADLVANAVAYTPPAGAVTVSIGADPEAGTVEVAVADTGPGIPAEELPAVFDFGFRGELARRLAVPGLGAGLWICRELARRNGGEVSIVSEPGAGTTATVTLPAAPAPVR
jgi:signal transduction histidine kinase